MSSDATQRTFTAVANPDDLRDEPGVFNDVVGCIRIVDAVGDQVDLVTYAPDEDADQAELNILEALESAGYSVLNRPYPDFTRLTVRRDR